MTATSEGVFQRADQAFYQAKVGGLSAVCREPVAALVLSA